MQENQVQHHEPGWAVHVSPAKICIRYNRIGFALSLPTVMCTAGGRLKAAPFSRQGNSIIADSPAYRFIVTPEISGPIVRCSVSIRFAGAVELHSAHYDICSLHRPAVQEHVTSNYRLSRKKRFFCDRWSPFCVRQTVYGRHVTVTATECCGIMSKMGKFRSFLDLALAHPSVRHTSKIFSIAGAYAFRKDDEIAQDLSFSITPLSVPLLVKGRYPGRHKAAIVFTDHADFDQTDRVSFMFGEGNSSGDVPIGRSDAGFAKWGIKVTKSVFAVGNKGPGVGLDNVQFADLIKKLSGAGHEICPHALGTAGQLNPAEISLRLAMFSTFAPATWVDHGISINYCYSMRGFDRHSPDYLLRHLEETRIRYIWSFIDFGYDPPESRLDMLDWKNTRGMHWLGSIIKHLKNIHVSNGSLLRFLLQSLYRLRCLLHQILPQEIVSNLVLGASGLRCLLTQGPRVLLMRSHLWRLPYALFLVLNPKLWFELISNLFCGKRELRYKPVLYPDGPSRSGFWLFSSWAVNDLENAYTPQSISKLIENFGIHIGHTYLCADSPYRTGQPVHWNHSPPQWSEHFITNMNFIGERIREGVLWNPTMREFAPYLVDTAAVTLALTENMNYEISNNSDRDFDSFQIYVYASSPCTLVLNSSRHSVRANNQVPFLLLLPLAKHSVTKVDVLQDR